SASIEAGHTVTVSVGETLADGLAGNLEKDSITVDILREQRIPMMAVSEDEIRQAIRALFQNHGVIAEGAAATAFAAAGMIETDPPGGAVVTGRNIAGPLVREVVDEGGRT